MKHLLVFCCLFFLSALSALSQQQTAQSTELDIHAPFYMPDVTTWDVVKTEALAKIQKPIYRHNIPLKGAVKRELKSKDGLGLEGGLIIVDGITVVKIAEVQKGHRHMAIFTPEKKWVLGEQSTLSAPLTMDEKTPDLVRSIRYCIEDYETKKPACTPEIVLQ